MSYLRRLGGLTFGAVLALALFYMLALMVAPPERIEEPPKKLSISMTKAVQAQKAKGETAKPEAARPSTPPAAPPRPEAQPAPSASAQSPVTLPPTKTPPVSPKVAPAKTSTPQLEVAKAAPKPTPQPAKPSESAPTETQTTSSASGGSMKETTAERSGSPNPTRKVLPEYPRRARLRGTEGFVELQYVIQRNGQVDKASIRVIESRPGSTFNEAAKDAVAQWRYPPQPQVRQTRQRIEFKLRG
ncbi:energy transducer TonB [Larsenimonas salina]|uniref:energy transducer TonB n=1 Tax=Larsenimonas salina TaxID=1295565 RepID=UPI0020745A0D|nr:energy transducer TonB [Larsenimonas salina]MCM5703246.1 TonB family protein [Larsenimonas salina]